MEQLYPAYRSGLDPVTIYDDLALPESHGDRPHVGVNMVSSVDGKITFKGEHRKVKIGSPVDRALMGRIRAHFDAVLRGAETVRANPYFPVVNGAKDGGIGVVVSRSLDLPLESDFFAKEGVRRVVLTSQASDPEARSRVSEHADVIVCGGDRVDLRRALQILRNEYQVGRLLVEGGAGLNYWFVKEGIVDTLFWTLAPKLSGFKGDLTMIEGPDVYDPIPRLELQSLFHHEDELYFRWSFT